MVTKNKLNQKGTFLVSPSYHKSSKFQVTFDDKKSVSFAGLVLVDELARKLSLIESADEIVSLTNGCGNANPGAKIMTLIESFITGGSYIDDADILRCGSTDRVVSHHIMAPSTLGTFSQIF